MDAKLKIVIINGPNLNLLGVREQEIYGANTLEDMEKLVTGFAEDNNMDLDFFQSNHEGEIIGYIHEHRSANGIIINPAAFTHTSIAIRDAIAAVNIPAVEVHLSNIYTREEFRRMSFIAPVCIGQISGFGIYSYLLALQALSNYLNKA